MGRDIIAVEVQGWDDRYWNLIGDHRDLTQKTLEANCTASYTATGLSGLPNTATVLTDSATSPSTYAYCDSDACYSDTEQYWATRVWILKDATSSPDVGIRLYVDAWDSVLTAYSLDTSTGVLTSDPATTATIEGSSATLRSMGGQDWWEVWLWAFDTAAYSVKTRIYPAISAVTDTRSVTVGNIEIYDNGLKVAASPLALAWVDLAGSPPNYGDVFLANEAFVSEEPGTYLATIFPSVYPAPRYAYKAGPTNFVFESRLSDSVNYSVFVSPPFWNRRTAVGFGSINVINEDGALDAWREWEWRDRRVTINLHNTDRQYLANGGGNPAGGAEKLLKAIVERLEVVDERQMRLIIRDPVPELYLPINSYYAINSPDTAPDAHYRAIPITFGDPKQADPVLINSATFAYDLHDTSLDAVDEVYVNGVPQSTASPTFSASGAGFTLAAGASGRVSADPSSTSTADLDAFCTSITDRTSNVTFDPATRSAYNLTYGSPEVTYKYAYYLTDATTPAALLNWVTSSFGGWWYVNRTGEVVFGQLQSPGAVLENLLIHSASDPRDLTTWPTKTATVTYYETGIDGERTASKVEDDLAGGTTELIRSESLPLTGGTENLTVRAWVLKDATSSPDPRIRLLDPSGSTLAQLDVDTSTGIVTNGTFDAVQGTERTLGGNAWIEVLGQVANASHGSVRFDIRPAGDTGADTREMTIGGVELYDNATISDVAGTPPNLTSSRYISDAQIIGDISITADNAPNLSDGMGANKNWARGRTSEGSGLNAEKFSREYQDEYRTTTALNAAYDHAVGADLPMSLHTDATAAQNEADRIALLYQQQRHFYRVPVAMDYLKFDDVLDTIGQTYSLSSDRYDLDALPVVLVGVDGAFMQNETTLTFWG